MTNDRINDAPGAYAPWFTLSFVCGNANALRRYRLCSRRQHHLRQKLLALLLGAIALHGRREALEDAVLEGGDDGVVHVALAADRRRIGELVGRGAHGFQHLLLAAALA